MPESFKHTNVSSELIPELLGLLPHDFRLDDNQIQKFGKYLDLILQWNHKAGLISPADEQRLIKRHIIESLGVLSVNMLQPDAEVLDLGTGAGFPGVPVKIAMPSLHLSLLDSRRMKALFLEEVQRTLLLESMQVLHERAEKAAGRFPQKFGFILARAVADLKTLWTWALPLLKKGGYLLAQKGGDLNEEMNRLLSTYSELRPRVLRYPESWPIDPSRCIIAIMNGPPIPNQIMPR